MVRGVSVTRERPVAGEETHDGASFADLAPVDPERSSARLQALPVLVRFLTEAPPAERPAIATQVNDLLIAMREPGHEAEEAELVMAALDAGRFADVVDDRGRSCRREAVETMLASGFPHALLLTPEDLAFARAYVSPAATSGLEPPLASWERNSRQYRIAGGALMVIGTLVSLFFASPMSSGAPMAAVASVVSWLAGLAAAALLMFKRPRDVNVASVGALVTVVLLAQFILAVSGLHAMALAAISMGVGLYVAVAEDQIFEVLKDGD
jgi:hypothetical protein